jgi:flagellar M-ring protein FliF
MDKSSGNPSGQVPANALSVPPSSSDGKSNAYSKTDKIINYEVSRFTKQTESPVARLRRLSVAVMVDSRYEVDPKSKTKEKIPVLRNEKEMEVLTGLVKRAMGFDEKRDDQISVNCIPFAREDMSEMAKTPLLDRPITSQAIRYGVIFGLGFLLIFGFLRPVARAVLFPAPPDALNEAPELPMIQAGGQTVASLEQQLFSPADMANEQLEASKTDLMRSTFEPSSPVNDLKKQLIACYNSDFDRTVSVLREWLKEDDDLTSRRTSLEEE